MARFACARWLPVVNHGGPMTANLGLILHHAVANGSLYGWFDNPASQVSATFWVAQDGRIEQYVDSSTVAWHAMQMNDTYCGVETEGCSAPPYADPMSDAMIEALARLYAEGHQQHGWPFTLADQDGQPGFGYHRMGVATGCPCDTRLNMRAEILTLAGELVDGDLPDPAPLPPAGVPAWPGRYFEYPPGIEGDDVATWQAQMSWRGWDFGPSGVDGVFGPISKQITVDFQAEKDNLTVDGIVGPETWTAAWTEPVT